MQLRRVSVFSALLVAAIAASSYADDGVTLKYKLAKGDKVYFRTKTSMKQMQNVGGAAVENQMDTEAVSSYTVDDIDAQGNYTLSIRGERLKSKAKFGLIGDYEFDSKSSERDKASVLGAAITPLYERMSGIVYQAKVSTGGDILEVTGYAEQLKDVLDANPLARQFSDGGTNESAKQALRELFVKLPGKPIKSGDSWDVPTDVELAGLGRMRGKSTYRFVGPDKVGGRDTAKADVSGETVFELNVDQDGAKVTGTLTSTGVSGTVHFDVVTGRVIRSQGNVTLGGDLTVDAGGMVIPIRNDQSISVIFESFEKLPE